MNYRFLVVCAVLGLCVGSLAKNCSADVTVHTVSTHVGVSGMNNINPGIGIDYRDVRFGALYNSFEKPSVYGAYIVPLHPRVRVGLGAVTGYEYRDGGFYGKTTGVLPLFAVEADITDNVSVLWFGRAINLELKFR